VSIGTIIAIVDQGTASAAEIVAAALRENDRAKLVGIPTYGKGTVQTFFDLDDGSGLKLTTARYYTPKGNSLESNGIVPDVRVEAFTPEEIVAGSGAKPANDATIKDGDDDPQLVAAVKLARQGLQRGSR
jgi:carboxyl-terminal processing protease